MTICGTALLQIARFPAKWITSGLARHPANPGLKIAVTESRPQADWQVPGAFPEELFNSEYVYYCGRSIV